MFRKFGHKCGLLSTVCNYIEGEAIPADHTTPDPIELNMLLGKMVEAGCEYAFMECSSHAIAQKRIGGLDLIAQGKIDTTPLITHRFPLSKIEQAYDVFENRKDGVIKVAIFQG